MLKDKVAVVTGAARGIGREIAKTFAGYGAKVVVNYNGSEERANSLVEEIKAAGGDAVAFKANVSDFAQAEALIKFATEQYGRVDILVNNAGITRDKLVLGMKEEDFDDVINTNLKGTFNCIKHVYRVMMKQKYGRIINMSSVVGKLCSVKGRRCRSYKVHSQGAWKQRSNSQCHRSWIYPDRYDRRPFRQAEGSNA